MSVPLEITYVADVSRSVEKKAVTQHLERILSRLNKKTNLRPSLVAVRLKIEIVFVGDEKITQLNAQYRHHNAPTDVLSFASSEAEDLLGSIVISLETADRQAAQAGTSLLDEVKTLAGHGFLHLLGYDHR